MRLRTCSSKDCTHWSSKLLRSRVGTHTETTSLASKEMIGVWGGASKKWTGHELIDDLTFSR